MSDGQKRYGALLQFGLMLGIIIATIFAGYLMAPGSEDEQRSLVERLGTKNKGILLSPTLSVDELALRQLDGTPWTAPEGRLRWRLLVPGVDQCNDDCRQMLYITRQIHVRLNKQSHRVERAYISLDEGGATSELVEFLEHDHPHALILSADRGVFEDWVAGSQLDWDPQVQVVILVDPLGQAMMFYTSGHPGTDILLDIEHLLKYSPQ